MVEILRRMFLIFATFLKYPVSVKGYGVIVRKSSLKKSLLILRNNVFVKDSTFGENVIVNENVHIVNCILEGKNRIGGNSGIGNTIIGEYSYVGSTSSINHATVGKYCSFGPYLKVGIGRHPTNFISTNPLLYSKNNWLGVELSPGSDFEEYRNTTIGNDVWIGSDVFLSEGISIGNGAVIGAGSVVTKDVPDYAVVGGVPAKIIRYRFDEEIIEKLQKLKWWDKDFSWIKKNNFYFNRQITLGDLQRLYENSLEITSK